MRHYRYDPNCLYYVCITVLRNFFTSFGAHLKMIGKILCLSSMPVYSIEQLKFAFHNTSIYLLVFVMVGERISTAIENRWCWKASTFIANTFDEATGVFWWQTLMSFFTKFLNLDSAVLIFLFSSWMIVNSRNLEPYRTFEYGRVLRVLGAGRTGHLQKFYLLFSDVSCIKMRHIFSYGTLGKLVDR